MSYVGKDTAPTQSLFPKVTRSVRRSVDFEIVHQFLYNKSEMPLEIGADVVMTSRLVSATRSDII